MTLKKIYHNFIKYLVENERAIEIWDEEFAFLTDIDSGGFTLTYFRGDDYKVHTFMMYDSLIEAINAAITYLARIFQVYLDTDELCRISQRYAHLFPVED